MEFQLEKIADTMDSREIAKLTGKRHDHVCRDIMEMLLALYPLHLPEGVSPDLGTPPKSRFESSYVDPQNGQTYRCYKLPKRECIILATGYRVDLRAAIIDRWAELEAQTAPKVPQTLPEALRLAADLAEKVQEQAKALDEARPAVEFVARYVDAKGSKCLSDVAKVLGIPPKKFIEFLERENILFRRDGSLVPYSEHMALGRFEVSTGEAYGHAFRQTRFTPAGIEWIARKVGEMQAVAARP